MLTLTLTFNIQSRIPRGTPFIGQVLQLLAVHLLATAREALQPLLAT